MCRPPVALERLEELPDGRLLYHLKRRWRDGTDNVVFEPLEFLERLAALVPAPHFNMIRYSGVLAPAASWRVRIPAKSATHSGLYRTPFRFISDTIGAKRRWLFEFVSQDTRGESRLWYFLTQSESATGGRRSSPFSPAPHIKGAGAACRASGRMFTILSGLGCGSCARIPLKGQYDGRHVLIDPGWHRQPLHPQPVHASELSGTGW